MRIALTGGTGEIGEALALRLGRDTDHEIVVGSRDEQKAADSAAAYREELADRGVDRAIGGATNDAAAAEADVVVLAVPAYYVADTVEAIAPSLGGEQVLVSPAVGMSGGEDGLSYNPPDAGSVAELAAEAAPDEVAVTAAFTNVPAERVADLDQSIDMDTPVVGDDPEARQTVVDLASEIRGLRGVDAGPLCNAAEVESLTPLLINVGRYAGYGCAPSAKFK